MKFSGRSVGSRSEGAEAAACTSVRLVGHFFASLFARVLVMPGDEMLRSFCVCVCLSLAWVFSGRSLDYHDVALIRPLSLLLLLSRPRGSFSSSSKYCWR